jgi:cyclophilin family peptidyl-prolyl cis-trans isomerase
MKKILPLVALVGIAAVAFAAKPVMKAVHAPAASVPPPVQSPVPSPGEMVTAAPKGDWIAIDPKDLLVMDLAADAKGKPRRVVIQLMPPPFSQGWIGNIRKLAAAHWWDGTSVNRVQDNYVVQWGDSSEKKALPAGLQVMNEEAYESRIGKIRVDDAYGSDDPIITSHGSYEYYPAINRYGEYQAGLGSAFALGWPVAIQPKSELPILLLEKGSRKSKANMVVEGPRYSSSLDQAKFWPVHCYGMVGVGRNLSPDTGSGAELYTVIGHAPRHLDRNIALVGRVIEGIEHLSSLPRGTEALGFYKTAEERVPILSARLMSEMPTDKPLPTYEYLSTQSASFAKYADARANRRDPFFIRPAGGADICNIPVPVRRATG